MIITIVKISRQRRQGISKKTGKEYDFESLGIAPLEDTLTDIDGDEFERNGRWINGSSTEGVTDDWSEGDKVRVLLIEKEVTGQDGNLKKVINFSLSKSKEALVKKAENTEPDPEDSVDPDDF